MTTADLTTAPTATRGRQAVRWLVHRWPSVIGIAMAASLGVDLANGTDLADLAPIVASSGLVYLGAAAVDHRRAAWPVFAVTFVLVGVGFAVPGLDPTWWLLGIAALLLAYGLVRGRWRQPAGLPLQTLAMVITGVITLVAVSTGQPWAGFLVAGGLLGHAVWDVVHHRADRVVVRSMAEFCFVLDTLLAAAVLTVTLLG